MDLPEDLFFSKINETPEFCCESKEDEKSKKNKNSKSSGDGVTTRVSFYFNPLRPDALELPKSSFLGTFLSPNVEFFNQFYSREVRWHWIVDFQAQNAVTTSNSLRVCADTVDLILKEIRTPE